MIVAKFSKNQKKTNDDLNMAYTMIAVTVFAF